MTASVLAAEMRPAATFVIWRSAPGAPTLNTPMGALPAKPPNVRPPTLADATGTAAGLGGPPPTAPRQPTFAAPAGPPAERSA
ncbi:Tash protein PEST motif family, partial [Burkholderia pseudomallei]